ncbi:dTDP-4-amino-4,6-dideoxygalactose transaminase [Synechococcus sp. MU1650]|uniref:dTDP-4-amino-4,6-dideoxygalactose transaminase n=1 Tax=Synechococcus sp. MU1650 TaxID=2508352 RepID=UPI001CF800BF|nr:dTDP-4-amino-4,6-dideoxygalactose transaminase [Synechococcus sp. MU1650]MCB4378790.1 dTDP-4-amino-4,6-dideoxygalactose transaminase [Synechococcus sp. MU1650]
MEQIPFNSPHLSGNELEYIVDAHKNGQLAGDGKYTKKCSELLESLTQTSRALITHSCTAALEMSAILLGLEPGDEVIMPSYTFVSTANAFVLRGAVPVFVDVDISTFNINPEAVKDAITDKTKAIIAVHYAGLSCDMDRLMSIASDFNLPVIEDAAQALMSTYKSRNLGSLGQLASVSFHETKNIISGEGGALLINDNSFLDRAEIIREKGTDRSRFFRGEVDKYTWVDIGSSYLPGELIAAFLYAQLQSVTNITNKRLRNWNTYNDALSDLEEKGLLRRQSIPDYCSHNAHMFFIVLDSKEQRAQLIDFLKMNSIYSVFHYVPLHSSPAGIKYGRVSGSLDNTQIAAERLLRLPMGYSIDVNRVVSSIYSFYRSNGYV